MDTFLRSMVTVWYVSVHVHHSRNILHCPLSIIYNTTFGLVGPRLRKSEGFFGDYPQQSQAGPGIAFYCLRSRLPRPALLPLFGHNNYDNDHRAKRTTAATHGGRHRRGNGKRTIILVVDSAYNFCVRRSGVSGFVDFPQQRCATLRCTYAQTHILG